MSSPAVVSRPLEGVRIVAFTQFLLGPAAVQYLADLGADVIKVEGPSGAWERTWSGANTYLNDVSVFFLLANRNCRSLSLDLKSAAGVEVARRLIASADVVLENFRPGVMRRFGLDYDSLHGEFPQLVYASASGYGASGQFSRLPGQDLLLQAMTGLAANTGSEAEAPIPAGAAVVDQHGAALLAMGVMGALLHRQRTGQGQHVSVTMVQAALDLQTEPLTYYLNGGAVAPAKERVGSSFHPGPYGLYPTTDGHVAISLSPVQQVLESLDATAPDLSDPAVAFSRRDDIRRTVAPLIAGLSTSEALAKLRRGGVWSARVNDYGDVLDEPAVAQLDPVMEVEDPRAGSLRLLRHPVAYSEADTSMTRTPPALGEHTDDVLRELGADEDCIAGWRRRGAFG
jgi:crotonobetainyl-CoA:carnitine CoA-transferase CaiB-like acyl-CoA transferase